MDWVQICNSLVNVCDLMGDFLNCWSHSVPSLHWSLTSGVLFHYYILNHNSSEMYFTLFGWLKKCYITTFSPGFPIYTFLGQEVLDLKRLIAHAWPVKTFFKKDMQWKQDHGQSRDFWNILRSHTKQLYIFVSLFCTFYEVEQQTKRLLLQNSVFLSSFSIYVIVLRGNFNRDY